MATQALSSVGFDLRRFLPARLTALSNQLARRGARLYAERFKLSAPQWRIVAVLGQQGVLSVNAVIAETAMDKVRVSRAVAKLLKDGLVIRETDPRDRRYAHVGLSAAGRALYGQIVPLIAEAEAEMMATLSEAEREALTSALGKIEDYLERTGAAGDGQTEAPDH